MEKKKGKEEKKPHTDQSQIIYKRLPALKTTICLTDRDLPNGLGVMHVQQLVEKTVGFLVGNQWI